jgi:hypothetical protein
MRGLAFLVGALALSAATRRHAPRRRIGSMRHAAIAMPELIQLPPVSVPAVAAGALALGALAVGALAIGALAIGRLEIRKARLREVEIDDLTVRRFRIVDAPAHDGEPATPTAKA